MVGGDMMLRKRKLSLSSFRLSRLKTLDLSCLFLSWESYPCSNVDPNCSLSLVLTFSFIQWTKLGRKVWSLLLQPCRLSPLLLSYISMVCLFILISSCCMSLTLWIPACDIGPEGAAALASTISSLSSLEVLNLGCFSFIWINFLIVSLFFCSYYPWFSE